MAQAENVADVAVDRIGAALAQAQEQARSLKLSKILGAYRRNLIGEGISGGLAEDLVRSAAKSWAVAASSSGSIYSTIRREATE